MDGRKSAQKFAQDHMATIDGDKAKTQLSLQKRPVNRANHFNALSSDINVKIATQYLAPSDARRFANICRSLFWNEKLKPFTRSASAAVHRFLVHVQNGDLTSTSMMLEQDPGLILERHSVGEHRWVTALMLAKRLGDIGMCRLLLNHLQAFDAKFGTRHTTLQSKEVSNSQKKAPLDTKYFDGVADAIGEFPSDVKAELSRHRDPNQKKTYLSVRMDSYRAACDRHGETSAEDLKNVFEALYRNYPKFKNYNQFELFFYQVIGYIARKMPLCLKMALNQGVQHILNNKAELIRVNDLVICGVNCSLNDLTLNTGIGFDYSFDTLGAHHGLSFLRCRDMIGEARLIEAFYQSIESALIELNLMPPKPESPSWCVLC